MTLKCSYSKNGQVSLRKDGNRNATNYTYDGFDRLQKVTFPDSSYEYYNYDKNGNQTSLRKRDGKTLTHNFNKRNQTTSTRVPGESTIYFTYDSLGRQQKVTRGGSSVSYSYDGLGRTKSTKTDGRTLSYQYDIAGRRTRLDYPGGYHVTYNYDNTGALTRIKEKGTTNLVTYNYNSLGRLTSITRGNGRSTAINYDAPGRINYINHLSVNKTTFSYNPANQISSRVVTNSNYQIQIPQVGTQNYIINNLNQYTSTSPNKVLKYDRNGNLTSYDGWSYAYNAHNRLKSAIKSGTTLNLTYDATGRLSSSTLNGSKTSFLYDGDELVAEYNNSGKLLRRYVHGIADDDPLVRLEGSGTTNKRYLLSDERGSIISETNNSGSVVTTHKYGSVW